MATKTPKGGTQHCLACGVDARNVPVEVADVADHQVIRCVDPVACRMRAQTAGTWCLV
jgi:hypothetical protein